jgi:hypothetical protein
MESVNNERQWIIPEVKYLRSASSRNRWLLSGYDAVFTPLLERVTVENADFYLLTASTSRSVWIKDHPHRRQVDLPDLRFKRT